MSGRRKALLSVAIGLILIPPAVQITTNASVEAWNYVSAFVLATVLVTLRAVPWWQASGIRNLRRQMAEAKPDAIVSMVLVKSSNYDDSRPCVLLVDGDGIVFVDEISERQVMRWNDLKVIETVQFGPLARDMVRVSPQWGEPVEFVPQRPNGIDQASAFAIANLVKAMRRAQVQST